MGGDRVDTKGTGGVPPPGIQEDNRDDGDTWGGREVVMFPGGAGNGIRGNTLHTKVQ